MKPEVSGRLWSADATAGVVLIGASAYLLNDAFGMPGASRMLPVVVLWIAIVLSVNLIVGSIRRRINGQAAKAFFVNKKLFFIAAAIACVYMPSVELVGFYTATTVLIPLTSWLFGYRNIKVIAATTLGFVGGMLTIFTAVMSSNFPAEFFLR